MARRKKKVSSKKTSPGMDALLKVLRRRPKASYQQVNEAVKKNGHTIFPIMYGRAQALLGLIRHRKTGKPKRAAAKARGRKGAISSHRRQRRSGGRSSSLDRMRSVLEDHDRLLNERAELLSVLDQVRILIKKTR